MEDYFCMTEDEVLERVDEYALYSFYLGYEPLIGGTYHSPIRAGLKKSGIVTGEDTRPSFTLFEPTRRTFATRDFAWKDNATGQAGGIFKMIQLMFGYETRKQAIDKVIADFITGEGREDVPLDTPEKKYAVHADIAVKSKPFGRSEINFWLRYNVNINMLQAHNVTNVSCFWLAEEQKMPVYPKGIGFAYRIFDKYQVYCPYDTKRKFRTSYNEMCLPGLIQLPKKPDGKLAGGDLLIITKSMKDIMCIKSFGYESVISCRSENTLVPEEYMSHLRRLYNRILILFDNDGKHKGDEYPEKKVFVPREMEGDKDVSDYCKNHGAEQTARMLQSIIST